MPEKACYVLVILNRECFFRCRMCDIWKNKSQEPQLDKSHYRKLFCDMEKISSPETYINFGGGELLLRKDLYDIISYASEHGFTTNLNTNGWLLDKENIARLAESGISSIGLSLDGSTPELHDKIRGKKGSFRKVFEASEQIKRIFRKKGKKATITVCFTLFSMNLHDAVDTAKLIQDTEHVDSIVFQAVTAPFAGEETSDKILTENQDSHWFEKKEYSHLWPRDNEKIDEVYNELIRLKSLGFKIGNHENRLEMQRNYFLNPGKRLSSSSCNANKNLIIGQNGDVFHCNIRNQKIGNITETGIDEIWNSFPALRMRIKVLNCKAVCHELLNCDSPDSKNR